MANIPNIINFIWLGSSLRKTHETRLANWARLNNLHHILNLWIDDSILSTTELDQLQAFSRQNNIQLKDVQSLCVDTFPQIKQWILDLNSNELRNYGALSDIYRFLILKSVGGWYFDTDIDAVAELPRDINLAYDFAISFILKNMKIKQHAPDILMSTTNSHFINTAVSVLNTFAAHSKILTPMLNSPDVLFRRLVTHTTTGVVARFSASRILINGKFLLHCFDNKDSRIDCVKLSKKISLYYLGLSQSFNINNEQSWLCDENGKLHHNLFILQAYRDFDVSGDWSKLPRNVFNVVHNYRYKWLKEIKPSEFSNDLENGGLMEPPDCRDTDPYANSQSTIGFFAMHKDQGQVDGAQSHLTQLDNP